MLVKPTSTSCLTAKQNVHAAGLAGALCRMFNRAIRWQPRMPKYLSSDHDPLFRLASAVTAEITQNINSPGTGAGSAAAAVIKAASSSYVLAWSQASRHVHSEHGSVPMSLNLVCSSARARIAGGVWKRPARWWRQRRLRTTEFKLKLFAPFCSSRGTLGNPSDDHVRLPQRCEGSRLLLNHISEDRPHPQLHVRRMLRSPVSY
jgi:hypothetical protein